MDKPLVLVTGATGLVAKHCIVALKRAGYPVRATVRDLFLGADEALRAVAHAGAPTDALTFVAADLLRDDGWDEAVAGCGFVLHVASPFPLRQPRDWNEVIVPAREGALRVLRAATRARIPRVVLTSSIVAVNYASGKPPGYVYTEDDWTDTSRKDLTAYIVSKTLAERAAWEFAHSMPGAPELAVINPALVLGPALDPDLSTSHKIVTIMAKGFAPAAPRVSFPVCDVRDVAAAHVAAMTLPAAAGQRFIIAGGHLSALQLGEQIGRELPDLRRRMPRVEVPDWMVRAGALLDGRLATLIPELGAERRVSSRKAREVLGLTLHTAEEAVRSAARSLRALHVI